MDVSEITKVQPAPFAVFDRLATHRDRPRFFVRAPGAATTTAATATATAAAAADVAWTPVTWGQLASQIRGVARWLVEHHLAPGDRVAIFGANSVAWAAAAFGVQSAGGVFVPIYPASTPDQVAYILEHAEIRFVFVGPELAAKLELARPRCQIVTLGDPAFAAAEARDTAAPEEIDRRLAALELDQPGMMLYTSGTSGNPKGVPLSYRNIGRNGADWLVCNAPLLAETDRDLLWLPMSHIFGFGEVCAGNLLGWETYLATPLDVMDLLPSVAPHVFMSVPAYWEKLARAIAARGLAAATGGNLRFCLSGGAGLKLEIKQQLHANGLLVIEGYGLTETSPTLTLNRPDAFRFDSVGKALPSVELRLDADGEILARGDNVFAGYYKDPDATANAFTADGWFRTGDVGRWTDDGFLQIIDRKKDILVTAGGKNVPPANIEARFVDDPVIERVVVYGDGKPYLVAAVWLRPETSAVPAAERMQLAQARVDAINGELARFETIKRHFIADAPLSVEDGTLTSSLKLRRKAVYERMRAAFEALY